MERPESASRTPTNKHYMEETIITTPKPQASSTIEKKHSYIRRFQNKLDLKELQSVPEREQNDSIASSRLSTQSSLGLLNMDRVDDFAVERKEKEDSKNLMPRPSEKITEKLLQQRKLAQELLDKTQRFAGLPLHLLKPDLPGRNSTIQSTIVKNESTVNVSDLEDTNRSEKISFALKEISARSSSLGNNTKTIEVSSRNHTEPIQDDDKLSEYNLKCNAIFSKIRESDMALRSIYNNTDALETSIEVYPPLQTDLTQSSWTEDSLIAKLQNELFIPGELAAENFQADELEWRRQEDTIPVDNTKNRLDLSCFSGIIGDVDVSLNSRTDEKIPVGDFFRRKTEEMEALNLKESPEKAFKPVPLLNVTDSVCGSPRFVAPNERTNVEPLKVDPKLSVSSVLSVTQIENALENMQPGETPSKFMKYLMKQKKDALKEQLVYEKNDLSTLRNSQILKDITSNNTTKTASTLKSFPRKDHIPDIDDVKENLFRNSTPKSKQSIGRKSSVTKNQPAPLNEIIVISSDEDSDWKDAKNHTVNKTTTTITDSIECSELDFSEDEDLESESGNWVEIEEKLESFKTCTFISNVFDINITSLVQQFWLVFDLKIVKIKHDCNRDDIIKFDVSQLKQILKYKEKQTISIPYITYAPGTIELNLIISLTDMVTKKQKEIQHTIIIESMDPEISLSTEKIDFDTIPEDSHKTIKFSIFNTSPIELPIVLEIKQKQPIYSFETDASFDSCDTEFLTKINLILRANEELILGINMVVKQLQSTSQIEDVYGKILIHTQMEETKILKEMKLIGKFGKTKIQFKNSCLPMRLLPGQTKRLYMKNAGVVNMELRGIVYDKSSISEDKIFTITPTVLELKRNQNSTIDITFNAPGNSKEVVNRELRLIYTNGPKFVLPLEGIPNSLGTSYSPVARLTPDGPSPKSKISTYSSPSPKLTTLRTGTSSSYHKSSPTSSRSASPQNNLRIPSPRSRISNLRIPTSSSYHPKISPTSSRSISPRHNAQSVSPRSVTSGDIYVSNGKLPIETNKSELVWTCVKPGKIEYREFVIRNKIPQRIRFYASIVGNGYKIVKDQNEMVTQVPIMLHGNESRTIVISFIPNSVQAYYAKLSFTPIQNNDPSVEKTQCILLFGYGGHSIVDIQKVAKTTNGKMWLSLGQVVYQTHLEQSFTLRNSGSLTAFAQINIIWKQLFRSLDSSISIFPNEVVLKPDEEVDIFIQFKPKHEDYKLMKNKSSEVLEVATLQLISGPEITRGRIRKLCNKTSSIASSASYELLSKLSVEFPNEKMPTDLSVFNERLVGVALKELLQGLTTREVSLTIEQNLDSSVFGLAQTDDTLMFHSLCNQTANLTIDNHQVQMDNVRRSSGGFCTIEPTNFTLFYPMQSKQLILLQSKHSRPMPFEIAMESNDLHVEPTIGIVPPREEMIIVISCVNSPPKNSQTAKVMVYVENQVLEISVKILKTRLNPLVE